MAKGKQTYKLPEGWIWTTIGEIGIVQSGGTPSTRNKEFWGDEISWISPADLSGYKEKYISKGNRNISKTGLDYSSAKLLPKGTILFSSRAPIGYTVIAKNELATNQGFKNLIPTKSLNSEYVYYYFQTLKSQAEKVASGTTFLELSATKFSQLPFPLSPLHEQQRIVSKIETLFSELDQAEKGLQKAKLQLEVYKQALLKSAFNGSITVKWRAGNEEKFAYKELETIKRIRKKRYNLEIQQGNKKKIKPDYNITFKQDEEIPTWANANLNNLIDINARIGWKGLTKKEYTTEGPLFLSVHSINYGKNVVFKDANHITDARYEESPEIKLQVNNILLCKDGAGIGKVGIIKSLPDKTTVNSSLLVINAKEVFNPDFLYYFFSGPIMQELVNDKISGSAIPHLFQKDIKKFNLKVPPKEEQNEIVDVLESRFALVENLEKSINDSLSKTLVFKHSILKKTFEGKLVEQNPNDESAQVLLQKIKLEKEKYLQSKITLEKLKPKKKKLMESKKTVLELLEEAEYPVSPQELWQKSIHEGDIESFYSEIKDIYSKLEEINKETEPLLILKK